MNEDERIRKLDLALAKAARREPLTKDEREEISIDNVIHNRQKIFEAMKIARSEHDNTVRVTQGDFDAIHEAVSMLLVQMELMSVAHSERRQELEQRVVHLEKEIGLLRQASPRVLKLVDNADSEVLTAGRVA